MSDYDKALAKMGSAPLEAYENPGPKRKGRGVGGGRKPGPGPRNRPKNPNGVRVPVSVTLDPDLHRYVANFAKRNGLTFSQALNDLLLTLDAARTG